MPKKIRLKNENGSENEESMFDENVEDENVEEENGTEENEEQSENSSTDKKKRGRPKKKGSKVDVDSEQSKENTKALFSNFQHSSDPEKVLAQVFSDDGKLFINILKQLSITELSLVAEHLKLENYESMHTQELIYSILRRHADNGGVIYGGGTLQVIEGGFGFLRSQRYNYLPSSDDIYVSPSQIALFRERSGDTLEGPIRPPKNVEEEKFFALLRIEKINEKSPQEARKRILFDNLTPLFPDRQIKLEADPLEVATRIMDIFTPIGFGQRGLVVSPPKAGKTVLLKKIANSIRANAPEAKLIIFLVDERPEEVTDMQRSVEAEVLSSTFDEQAHRHIQVAQMVMEKAKRMAESGFDVIILLDSITRLARAYNQCEPSSGRVLSGGIDANALHKPKKFFGSARNIEEGGSITILATALVETGSKMDDVIYEEFKGTGNMEIHLDRNLSNLRIYPAVDVKMSGTRREDLLIDDFTLERSRMLRQVFSSMTNEEIIQKLTGALKKTANNEEFLNNIQYFSK